MQGNGMKGHVMKGGGKEGSELRRNKKRPFDNKGQGTGGRNFEGTGIGRKQDEEKRVGGKQTISQIMQKYNISKNGMNPTKRKMVQYTGQEAKGKHMKKREDKK